MAARVTYGGCVHQSVSRGWPLAGADLARRADRLTAERNSLRARETTLRAQIDALDAQATTATPASSLPATWADAQSPCAELLSLVTQMLPG